MPEPEARGVFSEDHPITLDTLIEELQGLAARYGGEVPVYLEVDLQGDYMWGEFDGWRYTGKNRTIDPGVVALILTDKDLDEVGW